MIEILNYKQINRGKVIGQLDICITKWGLRINRISHVQSGDKKFFNLPNYYEIQSHDGSKKYYPYIQFTTEASKERFMKELSENVKEFCSKNRIQEPEPINLDEECPF